MKKILFVEDDCNMGEIIEMALSTKYHVLVQKDNINLVAVLNQFMPDVILINYYIRQKNAIEIIEEIKSTGFNLAIPIILFSGHPDIAALAAQIGAAGFLSKPFDLDELYGCIGGVLFSIEQLQYSNS